jgi:Delta3-Delta2-enoyl-CoA isomerase
MATEGILLEKRGKIAIITLNLEKKLNALNRDLYYDLAAKMTEVAAMPDIFITLLTGKGRFFSAQVSSTSRSMRPP